MDRVEAELRPALSRMESFFAHIRGSGNLTDAETRRGTPDVIHAEFSFAVDGTSRKFTSGTGDRYRNVYSISPESIFYVRRESSGESYTIRRLGDAADDVRHVEVVLRTSLDRLLFAPFAVCTVPLSEIMADPSFRRVGLAMVEHDGRDCIKMEYQYANRDANLGPGWVILSPDEGWAIRAYECRFFDDPRPDFRQSCRVEYGGSRDGVALPRRVVYTRRAGTLINEQTYDFEAIDPGPTPDVEFTLPFYGLPDLSAPAGDRFASRPAVWFFGLAIVALAVALILKFAVGRFERR